MLDIREVLLNFKNTDKSKELSKVERSELTLISIVVVYYHKSCLEMLISEEQRKLLCDKALEGKVMESISEYLDIVDNNPYYKTLLG